jgi:hypothetical protein
VEDGFSRKGARRQRNLERSTIRPNRRALQAIAAPSFQISKPSVRSALNGELRKNSGANAPTQGRKPP